MKKMELILFAVKVSARIPLKLLIINVHHLLLHTWTEKNMQIILHLLATLVNMIVNVTRVSVDNMVIIVTNAVVM